MAWLQLVPALAVATALVVVPGLPIAWALRLRGLAFFAASLAASVAVIGVASVVAPVAGFGWSLLPVLAVTVAVTLVALCVRLVDRRPARAVPRLSRAQRWAWISAFLIAAALIAFVLVSGIGRPGNFSQSYDNVFHLNTVAWILEHGDSSPFAMTMTTPGQAPSFYPTLWHAIVSLTVQLSGASIPFATNAVSLVVAAIVWPIGILFFARPFFAPKPANIFAAGILAAAFSAFPYHLFSWGILYPNLLSVALLPTALGFLHAALRHHQQAGTGRIVAVWVGFVGASGAAIVAHPNAVLGLIALSLPLLVAVARENFRRFGRSRVAWGRLVAIVVAILVAAVVWRSITTTDNVRQFGSNPIQAFFGALTNAPITSSYAWFVTLFVLGGIVLLWVTRRHRWLIASYLITVLLYVIVSSLVGPLRDLFTGGWYNDAHRIVFLLPITAMPLAARAASEFIDLMRGAAHRWEFSPVRALGARRRELVVVALAVLLILTGTRGASMTTSKIDVQDVFKLGRHSDMVSKDELKLIERLPETTPDDALIAGNPWNGFGLAFALGDREVLFPHLKGEFGAEAQELGRDFRELPTAEACRLIDDLGVTHMLDSSERLYEHGAPEFDGLNGIGESPLLTRVDREGKASLYEVTGCE